MQYLFRLASIVEPNLDAKAATAQGFADRSLDGIVNQLRYGIPNSCDTQTRAFHMGHQVA